jgi:hypothetical protein
MSNISENQNRVQYISTNHSKIFTKEFKQDYKTATEAYKNMSASHKGIVRNKAYIGAHSKYYKYSGGLSFVPRVGLVIPAVAGWFGMYKGHKLAALSAIQGLQAE